MIEDNLRIIDKNWLTTKSKLPRIEDIFHVDCNNLEDVLIINSVNVALKWLFYILVFIIKHNYNI